MNKKKLIMSPINDTRGFEIEITLFSDENDKEFYSVDTDYVSLDIVDEEYITEFISQVDHIKTDLVDELVQYLDIDLHKIINDYDKNINFVEYLELSNFIDVE